MGDKKDWRAVARDWVNASYWPSTQKKFLGDPKLAASYLPLARTLLGDTVNRAKLGGIGFIRRFVKLADGTVIHTIMNGDLTTIEIDASASIYALSNLYRSFIFIPKTDHLYVHAKALPAPYDVNSIVEGDDRYYFRYTYDSVTKQPIEGSCLAEVVAHDAIEGYGNQNFTVGDSIYSWWHSSSGDLPIIHIVTTDYQFLSGTTDFLVYTFSRRTFAVDQNEKLPCYTHAMVSVKYINDDTNIIDHKPVLEFGYFVEADGYYYFYVQKPVYYRDNKLQPLVTPEGTQLILGLHISGEIITTVTLQNPLKAIGPVFVTISVNHPKGDSTSNVATLLDVDAIINELCYPVRFSPDGTKFAGLFYTLVDEITGFALILGEFAVRDGVVSLTNKEIQTYQYTISSTVVRSEENKVLNDYAYSDETYDARVSHPPDNCHGAGYTDGAYQQKTTLSGKVGTVVNTIAVEDTVSTLIGTPTIAINYNAEGTLVRCSIDMSFTTTITNNAEGSSGATTDYSFSTRYAQTVPPPSIPNPPTTSPPIYEESWDYVTGWPNCSGAFGSLTKSDVNNYRSINAINSTTGYDYTATSTIDRFHLTTSDSSESFPLATGETTIRAYGTSDVSDGVIRVYVQKGLLDGGVYSRRDSTLGPYSQSDKVHYEQIAINNGNGQRGTRQTTYSKEFEQTAVELTHLNLVAKVYAYTTSEDSCSIQVESTVNVDEVAGYGTRVEQHMESDNVNGTTINTYTSVTGDYVIDNTTQNTNASLAGESKKRFGIVEYGAVANTKSLGVSDVASVDTSLSSSTSAYTLLEYSVGTPTSYTVISTVHVPAGFIRGIVANSSSASLCSDMRNTRPLYLYSTYRKNVFTTYGNDHYLNLFDDPIDYKTAFLKAIDTNLPVRYGLAQPPVNQPESGIGDHLCPIGLLRPLNVQKPKRYSLT